MIDIARENREQTDATQAVVVDLHENGESENVVEYKE